MRSLVSAQYPSEASCDKICCCHKSPVHSFISGHSPNKILSGFHSVALVSLSQAGWIRPALQSLQLPTPNKLYLQAGIAHCPGVGEEAGAVCLCWQYRFEI